MAKSGRRKGKGRGWGVPFPKIARRSGGFTQAIHGARTEEDLEKLRHEWIERYATRVQAHRLLGVSMGTLLEDIEERHHLLVARLPYGDPRRDALNQALHLIQATAEGGGSERQDGDAGDGGGGADPSGDEAASPMNDG
ncbi:MAG: hypothetical protein NVSMB65_04030 [Chloroflexota bacterium]